MDIDIQFFQYPLVDKNEGNEVFCNLFPNVINHWPQHIASQKSTVLLISALLRANELRNNMYEFVI